MAQGRALPASVLLATDASPEETLRRLADAIASHDTVEPGFPDRRLTGRIEGQIVRLHMGPMWFGHVGERNSFQVEFRGRVDFSEEGAILRGQIDLRARTFLRWFRWFVQGFLVLFAVVAAIIALSSGQLAILVVTAVALIGAVLLPRALEAGEGSGVTDARTLIRYLETLLVRT